MTRAGRAGGLVDGELMGILFPGRRVVRVELDGWIVDAVFRLDATEHERRARFGLGALSYPRTLRRLAEMPPGVIVDDPVVLAETDMLPDGIVTWSSAGVGRLVQPPLMLDAVLVPALGPARTRHVRVAERFAPYASRWVISSDRRLDPAVFVAASVRDVGLAVRGPELEVVVEAAPTSSRAEPARAWLLAEQAYGAWLATGALGGAGCAEPSNVGTDVGDTPSAGLIPTS